MATKPVKKFCVSKDKKSLVVAVPKSWEFEVDGRHFMYYPKKPRDITPLVKNEVLPDKDHWPIYPITVLKYTETYERALYYEQKAVETNADQLTSGGEGAATPRRKRIIVQESSSESENEENNNKPDKLSVPKPPPYKSKRTSLTNKAKETIQGASLLSSKSDEEESERSQETNLLSPRSDREKSADSDLDIDRSVLSGGHSPSIDFGETSERPRGTSPHGGADRTGRSVSFVEPTPNASGAGESPALQGAWAVSTPLNRLGHRARENSASFDDISTRLSKMEENLEIIRHNQSVIREDQRKMVREVGVLTERKAIENFQLENLVPEPFTHVQDLDDLNTKLGESELLKQKLAKSLMMKVGKVPNETVRNLLLAIATYGVWSKFNVQGRRRVKRGEQNNQPAEAPKKALKNMKHFYTVLRAVFLRAHNKKTEADFDFSLQQVLKMAPYRPGGAHYIQQ